MVQEASVLLGLDPALSDTSKSKALKLKSGELIKVEQALVDSKNENSCNMSYFEIGNRYNFED